MLDSTDFDIPTSTPARPALDFTIHKVSVDSVFFSVEKLVREGIARRQELKAQTEVILIDDDD